MKFKPFAKKLLLGVVLFFVVQGSFMMAAHMDSLWSWWQIDFSMEKCAGETLHEGCKSPHIRSYHDVPRSGTFVTASHVVGWCIENGCIYFNINGQEEYIACVHGCRGNAAHYLFAQYIADKERARDWKTVLGAIRSLPRHERSVAGFVRFTLTTGV